MSHFPDETGYGIGYNFIVTTVSDGWSPGYMYITAFEDNTTVDVNFDSFDKPGLDSDDTYFLLNASDFVQANKGWGLNLITSDKKISVMSGYETAHGSFVPLQFGLEYPDLIPVNITVEGDPYSSPVLVNPGEQISISAQAMNNESALMTTFFPISLYNDSTLSLPFYENTIVPLGAFESSSVQTTSWTAPLVSGIYFINVSVDPYDSIVETIEGNNFFTIEVWVRGMPDAPIIYNKVKEGTEDILLYWTPPATLFTDHYLIYRAESQTGFDFTDVWMDTSVDNDNGIHPIRISWNDTGAASSLVPIEYYYCIRTVNVFSDISMTSNTVGKWTKYFNGPVSGGTLDHTQVNDYSETLGTVAGFSNMQNWGDGGASADLMEKGVPGHKVSDVIENGEFIEGMDWYVKGWDETETLGSGYTRWNESTNAPGGFGGSLMARARESITIPGGFTGARTQTISEVIPASSFGTLSFFWRKEYTDTAPDSSTLQINLIKPDDSSVSLWQDSSSTWNVWTSESVYLDASYFDQMGTYKISVSWTFLSMMTILKEAAGWFDEIELNLTMPQTYYEMNIETNITGVVVDEGNDLEIYGYSSGESFDLQVFDGTTWNNRIVIFDTYPRLYRYQLDPVNEIIGGNVYTRIVDRNPIELVHDTLTIDYQRVASYNGGTSTFSLPLKPFVTKTVDWYTDRISKAISIKWPHSTGYWSKHLTTDDLGAFDSDVVLGKGYEIYSGECYFTFCGSPAANIRYIENQIPAPENFVLSFNDVTREVSLNWDHVTHPDLNRYLIYKTSSRMELRNTTILDYDFSVFNTWIDPVPVGDGEQWYYSVAAVNSTTTVGLNSTYSIGVVGILWSAGYDTFGLPVKPLSTNSLDWFCDEIEDNWGMNYYNVPQQRWMWHSTIMPKGAFDPDANLAEGYQISTLNTTKYTFCGV
jgi:hypothetical protein